MAVAKILFRLVKVCHRHNKENFIPASNYPGIELYRQKILSDPYCLGVAQS
jgi:hypothetical protein